MTHTEKAVIVEYYNEYDVPTFFRVYKGISPKQAIKRYVKENDVDVSQTITMKDGIADMETVARAYEIEIDIINS